MQGRHTLGLISASALAVAMLCLALFAGTAAASGSCDRFAAPTGSDSAAGTEADPFASPEQLAGSLSAGQTGCFRTGSYDFEAQELKITTSGVTLSSYPGETATLHGRLWIARGANGVTVSNLSLDGRNDRELPSPVVNSADATFDTVEVTNNHSLICFKLGDAEYGRAIRTTIENSRIHDCGRFPLTNMEHGIYIGQSDGAVIRDNWIYDNADRGVQIYPDAQGTQVVGNVIDGNGEGVVISGDGTTASSGTVVRNNVISNSKVRWNVESSWPDGVVGSNNSVKDNCIYADSSSSYYEMNGGVLPTSEGATGFVASGNVVDEPEFVNAEAGDYTLEPGSDCAVIQEGGRPTGDDDEGTIILEPASNPVTAKGGDSATVAKVRLVGRVLDISSRHVKIVKWQRGRWAAVKGVHLKSNGNFRVAARMLLRGTSHKLRMRAVAPDGSASRQIVLNVG